MREATTVIDMSFFCFLDRESETHTSLVGLWGDIIFETRSCVAQAGLEYEILCLCLRMLGLQACFTMPSWLCLYKLFGMTQ